MAQVPKVPPPPMIGKPAGKIAGISVQPAQSTGLSSIKDIFKRILSEITKNKTTMYMAGGYGVIMLFLISGIVVLSVNEKKEKAPPPNLTLPATQEIVLAPTATPTVTPTPDPNTTPTPTPTPTPDPTIGWQTFSNPTFGYSLRHPVDWQAVEVGSTDPQIPSFVVLAPDNVASPAVTLNITVSTTTRDYDDVIALKSTTRTAVKISGLSGIQTIEQNSEGVKTYSIVLAGRQYVYILLGQSQYQGTFNQIAQTFTALSGF